MIGKGSEMNKRFITAIICLAFVNIFFGAMLYVDKTSEVPYWVPLTDNNGIGPIIMNLSGLGAVVMAMIMVRRKQLSTLIWCLVLFSTYIGLKNLIVWEPASFPE